jgi:hypothetical protein
MSIKEEFRGGRYYRRHHYPHYPIHYPHYPHYPYRYNLFSDWYLPTSIVYTGKTTSVPTQTVVKNQPNIFFSITFLFAILIFSILYSRK